MLIPGRIYYINMKNTSKTHQFCQQQTPPIQYFLRKHNVLMFNTVRHCFALSINKRGGELARSLAGLHFAYYIIYLIICLVGIAAYL